MHSKNKRRRGMNGNKRRKDDRQEETRQHIDVECKRSKKKGKSFNQRRTALIESMADGSIYIL
jgi:hypothetical protein